MTDNNNKLRAVFLAALMVLWVFAGTMAFAGSAAAATNVSVTVDDPDPSGAYDSATHSATVTIDGTDGDSVESVVFDYSAHSGQVDLSDVDQNSVSVSDENGNSINVQNLYTNDQTGDGNVDTIAADIDTTETTDVNEFNVEVDNVQNPGSENSPYDLTVELNDADDGATGGAVIASGTDTYAISGAGSGADDTWTTGDNAFQGQTLFLDKGTTAADGLDNYQLREWDRSASSYSAAVGQFQRDISFDGDAAVIDTSNLEGDYVITARDTSDSTRKAIQTNDNGAITGTTTTATDDPYVEVAIHTLDAEFTDDSLDIGDSTTLEVDSNRNGFDMVISSDNLTQSQLLDIFPNSETSGNDDVIVTGVASTDELTVEFNEGNDLEEGEELSFDFDSDDTTASASDSITVGSVSEADVSFDESQFSDQRGDIVTVSATSEELSRFNITFGGSDVNYEATFEVEPNDDGEVVLDINTFALARTNTESDIYTAQEGSVANFTQSRDDRSRVLEAALYDVTADQHSGDTDAEPEEYDVAVVSLEERSSPSMTVHTAPYSQFSDVQDREGIVEGIDDGSVTESDTIAIKDPSRDSDMQTRGDTIIHAVDVSGLEGAFSPGSANNLDKLKDAAAAGAINVTLTQQEAGINQDPIVVGPEQLSSSNTVVVDDLENDTLYVVVRPNTLVDDLGAETGDEFVAEYNSTEAYERNFVSSSNAEDQTANDTFELVDREAAFDTQNGVVRVSPTEDAEIAGSTTVAPGTEMTVRARATGESPFLRTAPATVDADGNFAGEFDFSDISEGQNFTASIQRQSFEDNVETPGTVGELETAGVTISDQEFTGQADEIVVDSAFLPEGGFVTIHDGSLLDGATFDSVRGTSDYLSEGENSDVTVTLDDPYTESGTAIAMPHQDTNDNQEYDFVSSEGDEDGAYTNADGEAITDDASVTISTPTETPTDTPTDAPTDTATDAPETDTETPEEEQPGFGAVIALIALLGAALLAARRNAF
jgi:surface glycoprotein (TIGR04207 family)/PGF-CTERM protein